MRSGTDEALAFPTFKLPHMPKRTTKSPKLITDMQELAQLAGVSSSTVSRALSGSELVSKATRERIQALALKHRYQVNEKARNFRLKKTSVVSVAFMLDFKSRQHMSDPFFLEILGGIADKLAEQDYDMLLAHTPITNALDLMSGRAYTQSDGIIFVGQADQHGALNQLSELGKPMVVWGAKLPRRKYRLIGGDNEQGGYLATKQLLDNGRKRIAFFGNINDKPEPKLRHKGYLAALNEAGLPHDPQLQIDVPFEMSNAHTAISDFVIRKNQFDGIVCCSDIMALSAITTLQDFGIQVPSDVSIVGYDDITLASHSNPPLTTIRQNIHQAGRALAGSVLDQIAGVAVEDIVLPAKLIVRKSCGSAPPYAAGQ